MQGRVLRSGDVGGVLEVAEVDAELGKVFLVYDSLEVNGALEIGEPGRDNGARIPYVLEQRRPAFDEVGDIFNDRLRKVYPGIPDVGITDHCGQSQTECLLRSLKQEGVREGARVRKGILSEQ